MLQVLLYKHFDRFQEPDNKVGMQQKLAAELLSKEEILAKMQIQIRELTKNIKLKYVKQCIYYYYLIKSKLL